MSEQYYREALEKLATDFETAGKMSTVFAELAALDDSMHPLTAACIGSIRAATESAAERIRAILANAPPPVEPPPARDTLREGLEKLYGVWASLSRVHYGTANVSLANVLVEIRALLDAGKDKEERS